MPLDNSPTTQDALSLIVQNYNVGLDPELHINDTEFVFDAPSVNTDIEQNRNTRLRVRPIAVSGKYGKITIYYNRIDLSTIEDIPVVTKGAATTIADVITLINEYFGINLVVVDYVDGPLVIGDMVINADSDSLMFIGGLRFTLVAGEILSIEPPPP